MKKHLLILSLSLFTIFITTSCAKDETPEEEETPVPTDKGTFNWTLSSGQTVTADSAHSYQSITTIYAFKNGTTNSLEVTLSALSVGSYSISSSTGNTFNFVSGATSYNATSGSFNITANNGNKLSGNYNVTLSGGALTGMSGSFQDILKR